MRLRLILFALLLSTLSLPLQPAQAAVTAPNEAALAERQPAKRTFKEKLAMKWLAKKAKKAQKKTKGKRPVNKLAIAGFICALFIPILPYLFLVSSIALCILALKELKNNPGKERGKGLAIAGLIISGLLLVAFIVAAIIVLYAIFSATFNSAAFASFLAISLII